MDTRQLRSFLKIAELRSISRAAVSLGMTQPALSQQLLRLEDEVGAKLFRRTTRGVVVTEAGRVFEEHARLMVQRSEQAIEGVRELGGAPSGEVIFAAPPAVMHLIGVLLTEALEEQAPHVSVRLVEAFTATIFGWLEAGKVDLGILNELGPLRNLSARPLAREELVVVGPAGAFAQEAEIPAEDLAALPLLLPGHPHGLRQVVEREAHRLGVTLQVKGNVDALGQIVALVATGHGYSILPQAAVTAGGAAGTLSVARLAGAPMQRTLILARNPAQLLTHASVIVEDLNARIMRRLIESRAWIAEPESGLR